MLINKPYEEKTNLLSYDVIHNNLTQGELNVVISNYDPVILPRAFYIIKENYVNKEKGIGKFFVNRFPIDPEELIKENDYRLLFYQLSEDQLDAINELTAFRASAKLSLSSPSIIKLLYVLSRQKTIYWVKKCSTGLVNQYDLWLINHYVSSNRGVEVMVRFNRYKYDIPNMYTPGQASILTTRACNAACIHCYRRNDINSHDTLNTNHFMQFLDQCIELNIPSINLLGGEPLLRHDIHLIVKKCVDNAIKLKITTNGIKLADMSFVEKVAENYNNALVNTQISIDGVGEVQNRLRPGAEWDVMIKAFTNMNKANLRWDINTVLTRLVYEDLENYFRVLKSFNVSTIRFSILKQCGMGNLYGNLVLSPYEINDAIRKINILSEKYNQNTINGIVNPLFTKQDIPSKKDEQAYHTCNAMNYQFCLTYNMSYLPCEFYEPFTDTWGENFPDMNIKDFWEKSRLAEKYRKILITGKCSKCQYNAFCSMGCPAETLTLTKNLNSENILCWYNPELPRDCQLEFPKDYSYVKEVL